MPKGQLRTMCITRGSLVSKRHTSFHLGCLSVVIADLLQVFQSCLPDRDFFMFGKSKDQCLLSRFLLYWMYCKIGFSLYVSTCKHQVFLKLLKNGGGFLFIHIDVAQFNRSVCMGKPGHNEFPYIAQVNNKGLVFMMLLWELTNKLVQVLPRNAHSFIDVQPKGRNLQTSAIKVVGNRTLGGSFIYQCLAERPVPTNSRNPRG